MALLRTFILLVLLFNLVPCTGIAAYEKEPIKKTQSDTVAVTQELLEREGQLGPSTPTMRMEHTEPFLTKVPLNDADEGALEEADKEGAPWWERWFFWVDEDREETAEDGVE
jgi:hypothetical protein